MSIYPSPAWLMLRPIRAAPATCTGYAGLNRLNKTEAHVGWENQHFILAAQVFWKRRRSPGFCWVNLLSELSDCPQWCGSQVAVCSSFLFLDALLNSCGGQGVVTVWDAPACQKGTSFPPWSITVGCSAQLSPWKPPGSVQMGDTRKSPRGTGRRGQGEGSSSRNRNNSRRLSSTKINPEF